MKECTPITTPLFSGLCSPVAVAEEFTTVDVPLAIPTDRAVPLPVDLASEELVASLPAATDCETAWPPVDTATALAVARTFLVCAQWRCSNAVEHNSVNRFDGAI
jgi:hypothetical protein